MRKRRIFSLLTTLALCLSLLPVTALAAGTIPAEGGALKSGEYQLTGDVTLTAPLTVAAGENVTIDLNGHSISYTFSGSGTCSLIDNDGTLTITDTNAEKDGTVIVTAGEEINKYAYLQAVSNDGTFTLAGGTLRVASAYACYSVGIRTSAAGAVTTIDGGDIWVENTSGSTYGIYGDKNVDSEITLSSGNITVENSSGYTYGIYAKGGYSSAATMLLSGGSVTVEGASYTYGVYLQNMGLAMTGTDISVTNTGTSLTYGVYCSSDNENRSVSGGSVTVNAGGAAYGLRGASVIPLTVTNCKVEVSTTSETSNTYPCQYCTISGGTFTGKGLSFCTVTGGSYSFDPVGFYEPYFYEAKEYPSGTWTVGPYTGTEEWVKNLNSQKTYASLTKAAQEATVGDTLQLQADIDLQGYAATIDKGLTLDLNGHKLNSTSSLTNALIISGGTAVNPVTITDINATSHENAGTIASNQGIWIKSGDVTISKINIESKTTALAKGVTLKDYTGEGVVKLLGVNIDVQGKYASYTDAVCAVYVNKTATITANDLDNSFPLSVSVENEATGNSGNAYAFFVSAGLPDITVQGGMYSMTGQGEAAAVGANSNAHYVDIYDGKFTLTSTSGKSSVGAYVKNAKVYGGYFNIDPKDSLADGYSATTEDVPSGYTHKVESLPVATVGTTQYNTLQAAIDAALTTEDKTVTLIRDAVSNSTVTINGSVTISKGDYDLTFNGNPAVKLASGVSLPTAMVGMFDASAQSNDGSTVYYNTLSQALSSNASVKLARDVSISNKITLSGSRTIDFNGYDLTSTADQAFALQGYVTPIQKVNIFFTNNGSEESVITGGIDIVSYNYIFTFTLGKNVKVMDNNPLFLQGNGQDGCITANIYGSLVVDVESNEAEYAAIQGTGTANLGGTVINIYEGAQVDGNGQSAGIYHPQKGVLNIYGGTVTGTTGIYTKSGSLSVTGGTISGTGDKAGYTYNGNGFAATGEALVVDNCDYPGGEPVVNITGGEFTSTNANPIGSYKKSDDPAQNDGPAEAVTGFVTGGSFSDSLDSKLLDTTLKYELKNVAVNPDAPYRYFAKLEDAVKEAEGYSDAEIKTTAAANPGQSTTYTVTFRDKGNGTEYSLTVAEKEMISMPNVSRAGYTFQGWLSSADGKLYQADASVSISANTTFTAQWAYVPPFTGHAISAVTDGNGTVSVSPAAANAGETVTITAIPKDGYQVGTITVTSVTGQAIPVSGNQFTMPAASVTVKVTFVKADRVNPFTDVVEGSWYYEGVMFAYEQGIMQGTGDGTTFSPAMNLNRAMLMTMLARLSGVDTDGGDTWYSKGLEWAVDNGISDGTAPDRNITRQELMTMLYRYVGSPAVTGDLATFPDGADVADWAEDAMVWSVQMGLIQGDDVGALNPAASATRMEVAVILMRAASLLLK